MDPVRLPNSNQSRINRPSGSAMECAAGKSRVAPVAGVGRLSRHDNWQEKYGKIPCQISAYKYAEWLC
jgi:hypothetical protein